MKNTIDKKYTDLEQDILNNGFQKGDRTGTGTISVFGRQIRHDMSEGFPLLTTKKMAWKSMVIELLWFLKGDTNIQWLVQNDCNIWVGDAYKKFRNDVIEECKVKTKLPPVEYLSKNADLLSEKEFTEKIKVDDEFAKKWGDLGPIYGKQWREVEYHRFYTSGVGNPNKSDIEGIDEHISNLEAEDTFGELRIFDQLANVIKQLKENPDSRRIMVNAWNVGELDQMTLPPCHYGYQFWTRELTLDERYDLKQEIPELADLCTPDCYTHEEYTEMGIPTRGISLMWNQRSVDTFLGLPFNIASYGLLLQIIAQHANMVPLELIGNLGDTHLYNNHVEQAKEQIPREPFQLPKVNIKPFDKVEDLTFDHFELIDYKSHPRIKAPLSN